MPPIPFTILLYERSWIIFTLLFFLSAINIGITPALSNNSHESANDWYNLKKLEIDRLKRRSTSWTGTSWPPWVTLLFIRDIARPASGIHKKKRWILYPFLLRDLNRLRYNLPESFVSKAKSTPWFANWWICSRTSLPAFIAAAPGEKGESPCAIRSALIKWGHFMYSGRNLTANVVLPDPTRILTFPSHQIHSNSSVSLKCDTYPGRGRIISALQVSSVQYPFDWRSG